MSCRSPWYLAMLRALRKTQPHHFGDMQTLLGVESNSMRSTMVMQELTSVLVVAFWDVIL